MGLGSISGMGYINGAKVRFDFYLYDLNTANYDPDDPLSADVGIENSYIGPGQINTFLFPKNTINRFDYNTEIFKFNTFDPSTINQINQNKAIISTWLGDLSKVKKALPNN